MSDRIHLVVPNLNGATYLPATLESLNSQGAEHLCWWLQDGASGDESVAIARSLAREGIDRIHSEKDSGQSAAINAGLRGCGGGIIGYLNSDDELLSGAAQAILETFTEHPEADVVVGGVQYIDAEGRPTGKEHFGDLRSLSDALDVYRCWFAGKQWVQPEVFFRRRLLDRIHGTEGFDESMHYAFDYDFWVRAFRADAVVVRLPRLLARFRLHDAQKSADAEAASKEVREAARRHLDECWDTLPKVRRHLIAARLDYDAWARGETNEANRSFSAMLLRHPLWLLDPWVRRRVLASLKKSHPSTSALW